MHCLPVLPCVRVCVPVRMCPCPCPRPAHTSAKMRREVGLLIPESPVLRMSTESYRRALSTGWHYSKGLNPPTPKPPLTQTHKQAHAHIYSHTPQSISNNQLTCGVVCQKRENINSFAPLSSPTFSRNDINTITPRTRPSLISPCNRTLSSGRYYSKW